MAGVSCTPSLTPPKKACTDYEAYAIADNTILWSRIELLTKRLRQEDSHLAAAVSLGTLPVQFLWSTENITYKKNIIGYIINQKIRQMFIPFTQVEDCSTLSPIGKYFSVKKYEVPKKEEKALCILVFDPPKEHKETIKLSFFTCGEESCRVDVLMKPTKCSEEPCDF